MIATNSEDDSNVARAPARGSEDNLHVPAISTGPASVLTNRAESDGPPATSDDTTTPWLDSNLLMCNLGTTATLEAHDVLHRRVLEIRSQHNVYGGDNVDLGKTNKHDIHLSQPPTSSVVHQGLQSASFSQPTASTELCFSPLKTTSQRCTKDFRKL